MNPHTRRSLAPTKLAAGGTSLLRKVSKGDKSRPTGKKAHFQVCIKLRGWGRKVGGWKTGHIKSSIFFLISVGQSGNKDVPILKGPMPGFICARVHTYTHHLYHPKHLPEPAQENDSSDVALSPPGSFDSVPVLSPCLRLQHFLKIDALPPLSQEKGIFLQWMSWEVGRAVQAPHNKPQETPAAPAQCLPKISEAHLSVSLLVLSPVHSSCWLLRLSPSPLQTKANGC